MKFNNGNTAGIGGAGTDAKDRVAHVYQLYGGRVAAYALRRATSADAADVVAETFLIAWRRRDALPEEPDTLPWLYGVARRVLANQRRSTRRRGRLKDRLESEFASHDMNQSPDGVEEFRRVAHALKKLSEEDAELLRLITWEGLTPTEIATMLGIVPGTARQRVSRARQRLREELAADGLGDDRAETHQCKPQRESQRQDRAAEHHRQAGLYLLAGTRKGRHHDR